MLCVPVIVLIVVLLIVVVFIIISSSNSNSSSSSSSCSSSGGTAGAGVTVLPMGGADHAGSDWTGDFPLEGLSLCKGVPFVRYLPL